WALAEGVRQVEEAGDTPELFLFTDADIAHHPSNLAELVARLDAERRDLVSLMVRLRCQSWAERLMVPAFVFFFAMLYPFAWSNDPRKKTAAAAGGCVLLRRSAYRRIGGFTALRGALIDDCALAKAVKESGGSIWLGLALTYLVPPALAFAGGAAGWLAVAAWAAMSLAYLPMALFYGLSPLRAPLLPATAVVYLAATLDSARRYWQGAGGEWKGRVEWRSQH